MDLSPSAETELNENDLSLSSIFYHYGIFTFPWLMSIVMV